MSVLHGMADLNEQFQPLFGGQFVGIAIVGDLNATNEFHHKVRATGSGGACVQDLGDVGMIHQRQGLSFGFEASDDFARVHPRLNHLQGHFTTDRCSCSATYTTPNPPSPIFSRIL